LRFLSLGHFSNDFFAPGGAGCVMASRAIIAGSTLVIERSTYCAIVLIVFPVLPKRIAPAIPGNRYFEA
jgi:hypothetical protein